MNAHRTLSFTFVLSIWAKLANPEPAGKYEKRLQDGQPTLKVILADFGAAGPRAPINSHA